MRSAFLVISPRSRRGPRWRFFLAAASALPARAPSAGTASNRLTCKDYILLLAASAGPLRARIRAPSEARHACVRGRRASCQAVFGSALAPPSPFIRRLWHQPKRRRRGHPLCAARKQISPANARNEPGWRAPPTIAGPSRNGTDREVRGRGRDLSRPSEYFLIIVNLNAPTCRAKCAERAGWGGPVRIRAIRGARRPLGGAGSVFVAASAAAVIGTSLKNKRGTDFASNAKPRAAARRGRGPRHAGD